MVSDWETVRQRVSDRQTLTERALDSLSDRETVRQFARQGDCQTGRLSYREIVRQRGCQTDADLCGESALFPLVAQ